MCNFYPEQVILKLKNYDAQNAMYIEENLKFYNQIMHREIPLCKMSADLNITTPIFVQQRFTSKIIEYNE